MTIASPPDLEALLVALVLAPATYSRNRFFEIYKEPAVHRARRRASFLRSVLRHLAPDARRDEGLIVRSTMLLSGRVELTYTVRSLGLRRTIMLEPIEAALLRYAVSRVRAGSRELSASPSDLADRQRIEAALRRLAPIMDRSADPLPSSLEPDPLA